MTNTIFITNKVELTNTITNIVLQERAITSWRDPALYFTIVGVFCTLITAVIMLLSIKEMKKQIYVPVFFKNIEEFKKYNEQIQNTRSLKKIEEIRMVYKMSSILESMIEIAKRENLEKTLKLIAMEEVVLTSLRFGDQSVTNWSRLFPNICIFAKLWEEEYKCKRDILESLCIVNTKEKANEII